MYRELRILIAAVRELVYTGAFHVNTTWPKHALQEHVEGFGFKTLGGGYWSAAFSHGAWDDRVYKVGRDVSDEYLAFAMYAQMNPSPCVPKIYSIHMLKDFYVVEMEKLSSERKPNLHQTELLNLMKTYDPKMVELLDTLGTPNDLHNDNWLMRGNIPVLTDPYNGSNRYHHQRGQYMPEQAKGHEIAEARLALSSPVLTSRTQEKDSSLREQPEHDCAAHTARMAGVLPQVPRGVWDIEVNGFIDKPIAGIRQLEGAHRQAQFAHRLLNAVDFGRIERRALAHIAANAFMAGTRRDRFLLENGLQDRVEFKVRKSRPANIRHFGINGHSFAKVVLDTAGAEVPDTKLKPRDISLLIGPKPRQVGPAAERV